MIIENNIYNIIYKMEDIPQDKQPDKRSITSKINAKNAGIVKLSLLEAKKIIEAEKKRKLEEEERNNTNNINKLQEELNQLKLTQQQALNNKKKHIPQPVESDSEDDDDSDEEEEMIYICKESKKKINDKIMKNEINEIKEILKKQADVKPVLVVKEDKIEQKKPDYYEDAITGQRYKILNSLKNN
jgi:hypothetical protein